MFAIRNPNGLLKSFVSSMNTLLSIRELIAHAHKYCITSSIQLVAKCDAPYNQSEQTPPERFDVLLAQERKLLDVTVQSVASLKGEFFFETDRTSTRFIHSPKELLSNEVQLQALCCAQCYFPRLNGESPALKKQAVGKDPGESTWYQKSVAGF